MIAPRQQNTLIDCIPPSAHTQLLAGLRHSIQRHPALAHLWAEWPGSTGLSLASLESRPWASATFNGERHRLELRLRSRPERLAGDMSGLDVLIQHLDAIQLPLSGHALIDVHFADARTQSVHLPGQIPGQEPFAECTICFEALTLVDPPMAQEGSETIYD